MELGVVEVGRIDWVSHWFENSSISDQKFRPCNERTSSGHGKIQILVLVGTCQVKEASFRRKWDGRSTCHMIYEQRNIQERACGKKRWKELHGCWLWQWENLKCWSWLWTLKPALSMTGVKANRQRRSSWCILIHPSIESLKKKRGEETRPLWAQTRRHWANLMEGK